MHRTGIRNILPTRFFMAFPRGTDQRIVEKFRAAVEKIITTNEEYTEEIAKAYYQSPLFLQPEEALEVYAEIDELIGRYKLTELK